MSTDRHTPTDKEKLTHLEFLVRMLLHDLPTNRDWLDPFVESSLRKAVNAETPAANYRNLMKLWGEKS